MRWHPVIWVFASTVALVFPGTRDAASATEPVAAASSPAAHPLQPVIQFTAARAEYIRGNVDDFTCKLVERERIDGELQARQFAHMMVRSERQNQDGSVRPLAAFMQFVAPESIYDRRVLYIADRHEGNVLVRKGGRLAKFVKVKVDPLGAQARGESSKAITDIGLDKLLDQFVQQARIAIQVDPAATNTTVEIFEQVNLNDRPCTHLRVTHPQPVRGLAFHQADLFVDNQLHVPIRYLTLGWPAQPGQEPPLNEEYHYIDLQLNRGLTDADFSEALLEMPYRPQVAGAPLFTR